MKKSKVIRIIIGFVVFLLLLITYFVLKNNNKESEDTAEESTDTIEVLAVSADEISSLSFNISGKETTFTKEEDDWKLDSDQKFPVSSDQMTVLTDALSIVTASRVLEDPEDLKEYGLTEPGNTITISKTDGSQVVIAVGETNSSTGHCYIYLNDEKDKVYAVDGDLSTVFAGSLLNYAVETAYPTITGNDIFDIQVDMDENSYHLKSSESSFTGWEVIDAAGDTKEADSTNLGTLQSSVAGFTYARYYEYYCEDMSKYGLDDPYAVITAKYMVQQQTDEDSEDSEEAEQVEEEVKIYIGDEDQEGNRYVRVNDSLEVHAIAVDSLQSVLEGSGSNYETTMVTNVLMDDIDSTEITIDQQTHTIRAESEETEETETNTVYYMDDEEIDASDYIGLYSKITALSWQEKLADAGELEESPELKVVFRLKDKDSVEIDCYSYDSNFYVVTVNEGEQLLVNKMKVKDIIETAGALFEK